MSDNPITVLYVKDQDEQLIQIDPKTVANAVDDETNVDTVQAFINDGIDDWSNVSEDKRYQYATAIFLKNEFDDFNLKFKNSMKYDDEWDVTGQIDYSEIKLPVKRGYTYKIIGEETQINDRIFKPGDFIIINKDIDVDGVITDDDVDLLIGYGNEGTKIYRYVADAVKTKQDLLNYEEPKENSVIIVLNDESHNQLLSFYEYIYGIDYDYEVETYNDLLQIETGIDVPNYQFNINESTNVITLVKYIGNLVYVPTPYIIYPHLYDVVKVNHDETHDNETSYYRWENNEWVYIDEIGLNWVYMFSKEIESNVYKVKGSVQTYNDLPRVDNQVGDVWNVIDTGANYVWTENGWDKLSETVDLSIYETIENSNIKIANEANRAIAVENQLRESKLDKINEANKLYGTDENGNQTTYDTDSFNGLPEISLETKDMVLKNDGYKAEWKQLDSAVILRKWE